MKRIACLKIILWLIHIPAMAQLTVSGKIKDMQTGEALQGVSVFTTDRRAGTSSNAQGVYHLRVNMEDSVQFSYLGYNGTVRLAGELLNQPLVMMSENRSVLQEVVIRSKVAGQPSLSVSTLDMRRVRMLPALGGEKDILKAMQLMPGIKKTSDGASGVLVRGGNQDQNLIMLNQVPVYNPSHVLGMFSLFNSDIVSSASVLRGGFDAAVGGRLSSVIDIRTGAADTGYRTLFSTGLLATRACVQGKGGIWKTAFRVSTIRQLYQLNGKNMPFVFYDANIMYRQPLNARHALTLNIYTGEDYMVKSGNEKEGELVRFGSHMGNTIASLHWQHASAMKDRRGELIAYTSTYQYTFEGELGINNMETGSAIRDIGMKYLVHSAPSTRFKLAWGGEYVVHSFIQQATTLNGAFNENLKSVASNSQHIPEYALHGSVTANLGQLSATAGLRLSGVSDRRLPYHCAEPRIHIGYGTVANGIWTAGWSEMNQYIFQLSGSQASFPTEQWYAVTPHIKPQHASIFDMGYRRKWNHLTMQTMLYYKVMDHLVEYREGAVSAAGNNVDEVVIQGKGEAAGWEWSGEYQNGPWFIQLNYTLSKSERKFADLNDGKPFLARFDRRHDLNLSIQWAFACHWTLGAVWTYATGSRFTPVVARYLMPNGNMTGIELLPVYGAKNAMELAASHRLDASLTWSSAAGKQVRHEFQVGAYNIYNQTQPYRVRTLLQPNGTLKYQQVGLFGFVPSINYSILF